MAYDLTEFDLEREKHKFMFHTILYRAETIGQVLSKGPLLHYWASTFNPGNPEDLKRLREEKFWHDIMDHVYTETIEWPIINVFRNHLRSPRQARGSSVTRRSLKIVELKTVTIPCPFMVFKTNGYHECAILTESFYEKCPEQRKNNTGVLYAGFFTIVGWHESDIPKGCPRGFTLKQIDAKIQSLNSLNRLKLQRQRRNRKAKNV